MRGFVVVAARSFRSVEYGTPDLAAMACSSLGRSALSREIKVWKSLIPTVCPNVGGIASPPPPKSAHFPTNGLPGDTHPVNPKTILAANLLRLMQYAADHQTGEPSSQSAIARVSGLGRGTVQRALAGDGVAVAVDTLQQLASAYNLQAWQLLTRRGRPPGQAQAQAQASECALAVGVARQPPP